MSTDFYNKSPSRAVSVCHAWTFVAYSPSMISSVMSKVWQALRKEWLSNGVNLRLYDGCTSKQNNLNVWRIIGCTVCQKSLCT